MTTVTSLYYIVFLSLGQKRNSFLEIIVVSWLIMFNVKVKMCHMWQRGWLCVCCEYYVCKPSLNTLQDADHKQHMSVVFVCVLKIRYIWSEL